MALMSFPGKPAEGLYDPAFEHDACGVAFVAQLSGEASHDIVAQGLTALANLDHRGATGADAAAGKQTYPALLGVEAGRQYARELGAECLALAGRLPQRREVWRGLVGLLL